MTRENSITQILSVFAIGTIGALAGAPADAFQASPGYCPTSNYSPTSGNGLSVSDISLAISGVGTFSANDCYGAVDAGGSSSVADILSYANGLQWDNFVNGVQAQAGAGTSVIVGGIQYTLTAGATSGTGTDTFVAFSLSWLDTNGAASPNLPLSVDFAIDWKGGSYDVFYYFDDFIFPNNPLTGTGTIEIKVMNPPSNADLGTSHLTALFGNATSPPGPPTTSVPEPGTLSLLAIAAVLGCRVRSRRSRSI
jgi:hypothetical protein